jgi:phospholipase C
VFLTWDENGGFFDHVAPPVAPAGTPGEYLTVPDLTGAAGGIGGPIGLGFRVPLLVLPPFSKGGFLCSETFDHTSILRFLERRFGPEVPNLSAWRREATGDLTGAFNFIAPDRTNPRLAPVRLPHMERCGVSGVQVPPNSLPEQAPGHTPAPSGPV